MLSSDKNSGIFPLFSRVSRVPVRSWTCPELTLDSVIYFDMTITRAENFSLPQRSTELIVSAKINSDGSIWLLYVGVQSVSSRIETEAELDS